jgi:hypothetical protein
LITIQQTGTAYGDDVNLAGGNVALATMPVPYGIGELYANTIEGTELKAFYTDTSFTEKWIPPFTDKFYIFQTSKNYDPNDTGKYSAHPYYCAKFDGNGQIIEQALYDPNSQTAWIGLNIANTGPIPITNYSYNIYYEEPTP